MSVWNILQRASNGETYWASWICPILVIVSFSAYQLHNELVLTFVCILKQILFSLNVYIHSFKFKRYLYHEKGLKSKVPSKNCQYLLLFMTPSSQYMYKFRLYPFMWGARCIHIIWLPVVVSDLIYNFFEFVVYELSYISFMQRTGNQFSTGTTYIVTKNNFGNK